LKQVRSTSATTYDIPELLRLGNSGIFRVPQFQRNYVWDADDVRKLFDSVWRGFPIGTLLLWRHEAPAGKTRFGPLSVEVAARSDALWVVDGQQRLTTLMGVLNPTRRGVDERFEVYFDLRRQRFITSQKDNVPPTWLPLYEAIETRRLLGWLRDHTADLEDSDFDVADALGGALRDYQVPAYIVEGDDEFVLRSIFDRVNSAGKPIGRTEVFHALFASDTDPGSPSNVTESLRRLAFGEVDANRVVQSLIALRGGNVQRDLRDEFLSADEAADWYDKTEQALARSIKFLRQLGILHIDLLPSTFPLPVLAAFFHLHPDPDPWTLRLLGRWLWRGWAHGFGRRGQTPALRQAIRAVNPKENDPQAAPNEVDAVLKLLNFVPDDPPPVLNTEPFRTDTAAGRMVLLALAHLKPLGDDGKRLEVAGLIEQHSLSKVTDLIRKRRGFIGARGFWPPDRPPLAATLPDKILASHLIDPELRRLLANGLIDEFIDLRGRLMLSNTKRFLTARIEPKMPARRPLSDLLVEDPESDH
jgi:hypothetical protein